MCTICVAHYALGNVLWKLHKTNKLSVVPNGAYILRILMLVVNLVYAYLAVINTAFLLLPVFLKLFYPNMRDCPDGVSSCYNALKQGQINSTCTQDYLGMNCDGYNETIRYIGLYRTWEFGANQLESGNWQLILGLLLTWWIIIVLLIVGIRFLGNCLLIIFIVNIFINYIFFIMAAMKDGGTKCLGNMIFFNFENVNIYDIFMTIAFTTFKLGLVKPMGVMTHVAYLVNWKYSAEITTLLIIALHSVINICQMFIIYFIMGVLSEKIGVSCSALLPHGPAMYTAVFGEFFTYFNTPGIVVILFHLSHWLLEVSKISIQLHMLTLNIIDLKPSFGRFKQYIILIMGFIGIFVAIILHFIYFINGNINQMLIITQIHAEQLFLLAVESFLLFYCYGVKRICEDYEYVTGNCPMKIWKAYVLIYPVLCIILTYYTLVIPIDKSIINKSRNTDDFTVNFRFSAILIEFLILTITSFGYVVYHFKKMKHANELFKPEFYFGPPSEAARIVRKTFIRLPKRLIKYRLESVRVEHRLDELKRYRHARVFQEDYSQFHEQPRARRNREINLRNREEMKKYLKEITD
ncbi:sodium- and chloride-dependent glycine transporter 2-like isoform X2 [Atheta coriaria]|uniref:sodium- and chloride-dependent glycine transporter 2-like isoform X2 n=1 Tax=Dalotia coriaria TaxID=877792 RepID=UPI0031F445FA